MQQANGMMAVWLDVPPEREEEFNAWYEMEHIADVVSVEGFLSGRRYFNPQGPLRFLALYEAVDESVEPGPGFQRMVAQPTPWTRRIRAFFGDMRVRSNLRRIADSGPAGEPGAIVTVHLDHAPDSAEGLARRTTFAGCTRYRAFHVAGEPTAGFEIHDFTDLAAAEAARAQLGRAAGSRVAVMQAIGTPYQRQANP